MSSACLLCLIGLPGAGKSKLAETIKNNFDYSGVIIIEYDKLLSFKNLSDGQWKKERKDILEFVKVKVQSTDPKQKMLIILDDNFYYRSMRYEYYVLAKELQASYCQIYMNTPVIDCVENNLKRYHAVPNEVLLKINFNLEPPDPSRFQWENRSLVINSLEINISEVEQFIIESFQHPIRKREKESKKQIQSKIHYMDLSIRKCISNTLSKSNHLPSAVKAQLISLKSELIRQVKSGEISLPEINEGEDITKIYLSFVNQYVNEFIERASCVNK